MLNRTETILSMDVERALEMIRSILPHGLTAITENDRQHEPLTHGPTETTLPADARGALETLQRNLEEGLAALPVDESN